MTLNIVVENAHSTFVTMLLISIRLGPHYPGSARYIHSSFQLPDRFKDFVASRTGGKGLGPAFIAYCNRELFHAQWELILDDEFVEAHTHGMVITCADRLARRFYLQIFTYSADYPEK